VLAKAGFSKNLEKNLVSPGSQRKPLDAAWTGELKAGVMDEARRTDQSAAETLSEGGRGRKGILNETVQEMGIGGVGHLLGRTIVAFLHTTSVVFRKIGVGIYTGACSDRLRLIRIRVSGAEIIIKLI
jgi:hypothetical protein